MTTLGIRRTFWQAQSDRDKDLLRFASDELGLGQPGPGYSSAGWLYRCWLVRLSVGS